MAQANVRDVFEGGAMAFTEARIEQARRLVADGELPTDNTGRRSWRDEGCRGLVLVVNQRSGSASLYFQGTLNGRTVRRAIGDVENVRLEEARRAVGRLRYDRSAAGALAPRPAEPAEAESPTVGSVVGEMLDAHEAGRWLPGTRSRVPLPRTMKFYRDLRKARTSKTDRLTRTAERARTRILTDAEWRRLDKAMAADVPIWRDLFSMSLHTLQRMGAVRHMRWSDLTLTGKGAEWRIPASWMKGRRHGHVVPLAELPEAIAILRARRKVVPKSCPWVYPGAEGEPIDNHDKAWDRLIRAAGLWHEDAEQRPRPHDLRRTGGARMTAAGVPLQTVTRALGDAASSAAMVCRTYAQVSDEALRAAFAASAGRGRRKR